MTAAHPAAEMGATARAPIVGNRWVLAGGVLYLLEFVAIIGVGLAGVSDPAGTSPQELLDAYLGNVDAMAAMAGWFSLVLLGRVLVFVGLRSALADSGRPHPLMDFAVVAAGVSVALEVAAFAMLAAAADLADAADTTALVVLDRAGGWLNAMIYGGLALAIVTSSWSMRRSGLFSTPLVVFGMVAGVGLIATQLTVAPSTATLSESLSLAVVLFWVWMLWTGVLLWRRTPSAGGQPLRD